MSYNSRLYPAKKALTMNTSCRGTEVTKYRLLYTIAMKNDAHKTCVKYARMDYVTGYCSGRVETTHSILKGALPLPVCATDSR